MFKEPNLFIVGFQKCGSSTLFNLLSSHPGIIGSNPKETYFLVDKSYELHNSLKNINNSICSWEEFFDLESCSGPRYYLESSVCNFYQATALNYIKELEDVKVIFIIRDPIQRFLSVYKYNLTRIIKRFGSIDIEWYINMVSKKSTGIAMCDNSIEHGKYSRYIKIWEKELSTTNVHVTSLEQLIRFKENTITNISNFLELENLFVSDKMHKNPSLVPRNVKFHKFIVNTFGGAAIPFKSHLTNLYNSIFFEGSKNYNFDVSDVIKLKFKKTFESEYNSERIINLLM